MGNGNSTSSKSKVHESHYVPRQGKLTTPKAHVANFPTQYGASSFSGENVNKPMAESPYNSEHHGKKSVLDNDDTFNDYILRAKQKIRTASNVGRENSDAAVQAVAQSVANGGSNNNKESYQSDRFSEFIQHAKKKLRTTSRVGKNGSFRRG